MILATKSLDNNSPLTQKIFVPRSVMIAGIRSHFLKTGILTDGLLTLVVKVDGVTVTTLTKTYTDINALGTNWHGMLSWEFTSPINVRKNPLNTDTTIEFITTMSSHTDSPSIFTALVHSSDPATGLVHQESEFYFPDYGTDASQDVWNNPYGLELYIIL